MIPLVFGMVSARWLHDILKNRDNYKWGNTGNMGEYRLFKKNKYEDFLPNQTLIDSIKVFEAGGRKPIEKAYKHSNERQYTIGFGTSYLYTGVSNDFKPFVRNGSNGVKFGDTLTSLKREMGYSNLNSEKFAEQLVYNYFRGSGTYNRIAKHLDELGVAFSIPLAHFLMEWSYGTSCAFYLTKYRCNSDAVISMYKSFLNFCKSNDGDEKAIALKALKFRIVYLKRLTTAFKMYKKGWLIRTLVVYLNATGVTNEVAKLVAIYQRDIKKFKADFFKYTGLNYDII